MSDVLVVFGGAYSDAGDAMADFAEMQELHFNGEIGDYDAAIVTKEESGQLVLSNGDSTGHYKGAVAGGIVGGVLGLVFPPSLVVTAALGAGAGALAGGVRKFIGRGDMKELGELLDAGESGILLVTDHVTDDASRALLPRARRKTALDVEGNAADIKAAVRAAAELRHSPEGVGAAE